MVRWPGQDPTTTPLPQAIQSRQLENVEVLLQAGANPSGVDMSLLGSYQALFLRFRPSIPTYVDIDSHVANRRTLAECMGPSQATLLTDLEISWNHLSEPVLAWRRDALWSWWRGSHQQIFFDRLLSAGADTSFWVSGQRTERSSLTSSRLSVTTPLHAAVELGDIHIIYYLHSKGFAPNTIPLSTPQRGSTPLATIFSPGTVIHSSCALPSQVMPQCRRC